MRVTMFVYNNCTADVRVLREAAALRDTGHQVRIIAVLDGTTEPSEWRDGIRIDRIDRNPPHYPLLRWSRRVRRGARLARASLRRRRRRLIRRARARVSLTLRRRVRGARRRAAVVRRGWRVAGDRLVRRLRGVRTLRPLLVMAGRALRTRRAPPAAQRPRPHPVPAPLAPAGEATGPASSELMKPAPASARRGRPLVERALMTLHKPLMFLDYYWRAYRLCGREPANVYHAHDLNTLPVAAAAARSTGGKLVYDAHELYTEISTLSRRERRVWRRLERLLIGRADATISVCDSIAEELSKRYGVQRPTVVLNCPSGPRPVSRRPELLRRAAGLRSEGAAVVLYQGGFVPHRGLPELVRASRWFDGATLVMMGWGRLEQELRRLVEEEELAGVVRFAPPVSQRELLTHSAGADVGVIPYQAVGLNNFYTTPNKLFEYMAAGLPIAASRFPELVRFVEGLEVGRTFDPTRPRDIAAAVNGILADDAARDAMRERALAAARTYCWEREAPRVVDLYAGLAPAGLAVAQR